MAIAVYFHPAKMNAKSYDEAMRRLAEAGQGKPKGRRHHSCFGTGESLMVYDVWESQEAFDAFGAILMPILQEISLDPGQPDIMPVHNIVD